METERKQAFSVLRKYRLRTLPEAMADCYSLAKPADYLIGALHRIWRTLPPDMQEEVAEELLRRGNAATQKG